MLSKTVAASFDIPDENYFSPLANRHCLLRYNRMGKWFVVFIVIGVCSLAFLMLIAALA
jgi:hypothetical protein